MHKILYVCFYHSLDDARLYYRQAKFIINSSTDAEIAFIHRFERKSYTDNLKPDEMGISVLEVSWLAWKKHRLDKLRGEVPFAQRVYRKIARTVITVISSVGGFIQKYRLSIKFKPDVVQVSDVRELLFGCTLKALTGCKLVYDIHEKTFHFVYQVLGQETLKSFIRAKLYEAIEKFCFRFTDAVFYVTELCVNTKEIKEAGAPKVKPFYNFLNPKLVEAKSDYSSRESLNIVYIGTINKYRGLLEASVFIEKYNQNNPDKTLKLHIYAPDTPILSQIQSKEGVYYQGTLPFEELMQEIRKYDIGICTLLPIEKYKESTPMKNFEYMALGLPIITSNFGSCEYYVERANCGYCIDPTSYKEFEYAIHQLVDDKKRERLGKNGLSYVQKNPQIVEEREQYESEMLSVQ